MIKRTVLIGIVVIAFVALSAAAVNLYMKKSSLDIELAQSQQIIQKIQNEMDRLESDKNKALAQNEKLQQDALSFVDSNAKLQQEKEEAAKMLEAAKTLLKRKEFELSQAKQKLDVLNAKISSRQTEIDSGVYKEKKELESRLSALEAAMKKERALFHYNLAVAYTKSKLYDDAIEAYEKSLGLDPNNADAHYNLGLLYSDVKNNSKKAIAHYKKYLELKPDAEDRDDVQGWIDKLR